MTTSDAANNLITDTLVLKLEEYDSLNRELDTTLYILYDSRTDHYVVRGKRSENAAWNPAHFSFECHATKRNILVDFIQVVIDKKNYMSYILYNYDNLPEYSNDITYDFLKDNDDRSYEITGYDELRSTSSQLMKYLRILRGVFNYY